ncbi:MAG: NIPSNAP family protein [Pyrinomonadaceae bacterium]|nr:NIPSNAP family protein [Pyrinomonadaceae bacterium]
MKRRNFLASSAAGASYLAAGMVATNAASNTSTTYVNPSNNQSDGSKPEYYELRLYHLRFGKENAINGFLREVWLPAMKRQGSGPVGVFSVMIGPDSPTLYALIPHKSPESIHMTAARLAADAEYQKAGTSFINIPSTDPAYVRMESSLMVAFSGMPQMEVPAAAAGNKSRIFELRTYESHNETANKKKIEMFNIGEISIFRKTGLQPVFFGETLIGPRMPNLTYMLTFENMAVRDKNWGTFVADPEWKKLSTSPGYGNAEILTSISSVFLRPTPYSQI